MVKEYNMKIINLTSSLVTFSLLLSSNMTLANTPKNTLVNIQHQWAECQYNISDEESQISCLEDNILINKNSLMISPKNNELKVWLAINTSTLAGIKGGLDALSLVKESKVLLDEVIASEPTVLNGSAYTSLGSLYYQVPGWPLGFGDDEKAEEMLKNALEINPDGIDPNYFYADFLKENGKKKESIQYFKRAQRAPARPDRPLADKGRLDEIITKLQEL